MSVHALVSEYDLVAILSSTPLYGYCRDPMKHRCSRVCAAYCQQRKLRELLILTRTRVIMDLCSYSKVAVNLRPFSIDHDYSQACPLGLVLCECRICIVRLEVLNLLEVGLLLYRTHCAVVIVRLVQVKSIQKFR